MNLNKYTEKAREAVAGAIELARQQNNPQLEPEHLLVALVEQREGIIPDLLRKMNADPAHVGRASRGSTTRRRAAGDLARLAFACRLRLSVLPDHAKPQAAI